MNRVVPLLFFEAVCESFSIDWLVIPEFLAKFAA
jgi:hypothetical protein